MFNATLQVRSDAVPGHYHLSGGITAQRLALAVRSDLPLPRRSSEPELFVHPRQGRRYELQAHLHVPCRRLGESATSLTTRGEEICLPLRCSLSQQIFITVICVLETY